MLVAVFGNEGGEHIRLVPVSVPMFTLSVEQVVQRARGVVVQARDGIIGIVAVSPVAGVVFV